MVDSPIDALAKGTELQRGKYEIVEVLGYGGFGITYKAMHTGLQKVVVIKECYLRDRCYRNSDGEVTCTQTNKKLVDKAKGKFRAEAIRIASLESNDHIVRVHDVFDEHNTVYYVMDFLPGGSLADRIHQYRSKNSQMPVEEIDNYISQMCEALAFIHQNKICHYDIKPENVMFNTKGLLVLIDFGVAKQYDDQVDRTSSTVMGLSIGYAPKEQYSFKLPEFSPATDIYSLGATLFCMITGAPPQESVGIEEEDFPDYLDCIPAHYRQALESALQLSKKKRLTNATRFWELICNSDADNDEFMTIMPEDNGQYQEAVNEVKLYRFERNRKYGFRDDIHEEIITCKWNYAGDFIEGLAMVEDENHKSGFIDKTGKVVIPCKWDWAGSFSEGLAGVENKNHKRGFIDKTGKVVIPCKWNRVDDFIEGLARVEDENEKWGFINKTGKVVIPCKWNRVDDFIEGLAGVENENHKRGFIDKTGKVVIPCKWKEADGFTEGLARVKDENHKYGFIDKTGKVVIPCKWYYVYGFIDGLARIRDENHKYGFIDKTGKVVSQCKWEEARNFSDGLAWVMDENDKYGFIDKTGKVVSPCKWNLSRVDDFIEGLARVEDENYNCGCIDKTGKMVIPCKWEWIDDFSEGLARVIGYKNLFKFGFIDKTGKMVSPCKWDGASIFSEGLARVKNKDNNGILGFIGKNNNKNNKWGFIDKTGKVVIPCKWSRAYDFTNGLARVMDDNGIFFLIDKTGKVVSTCD